LYTLVAANESGYLEEAGAANTYFTLARNGRLDKGRWMVVSGVVEQGQPSSLGHTWRLVEGREGTIVLWNSGRQMYMAVSDHGLWKAGHIFTGEKNSEWSVFFVFFFA
jgi:hypothetical protein